MPVPPTVPTAGTIDTATWDNWNAASPLVLKRGWIYEATRPKQVNGSNVSIRCEPGDGPLPMIRYRGDQRTALVAMSSSSSGLVFDGAILDLGTIDDQRDGAHVRGKNHRFANLWVAGGNTPFMLMPDGTDGVTLEDVGLCADIGGCGIYADTNSTWTTRHSNLTIRRPHFAFPTASRYGLAHLIRLYAVYNGLIEDPYLDNAAARTKYGKAGSAALRIHCGEGVRVVGTVPGRALVAGEAHRFGPLNLVHADRGETPPTSDPSTLRNLAIESVKFTNQMYLAHGLVGFRFSDVVHDCGSGFPVSTNDDQASVTGPNGVVKPAAAGAFVNVRWTAVNSKNLAISGPREAIVCDGCTYNGTGWR
jgi:hypothetical protein